MTIKAFSDQTEIPYRSVQSYLRAERELSIEAATKIATALGISLNWLVLGKGQIYATELTENLTSQEQKLLKQFHQCNEIGKKAIEVSVEAISMDKLFNDEK